MDGEIEEYEYTNAKAIAFASPPPVGSVIIIERETPYDEPWINWTDGTVMVANDLNAQLLQVLYVLQENKQALEGALAYDDLLGAYDALERRISNLADPIDPQDAVTYKIFQQEITILREEVAAVLDEAGSAVEAAKNYAEEARRHAQDYIPYSFGRFKVNEEADLVVDYYGDAGKDDIKINEQGFVIVYSDGEEKINIGKVRPLFRGSYDETTEYRFFDCVLLGDNNWLHVGQEPTTGVQPQEGSVWTIFGGRGAQGATGPQGPQGERGEQGVQGPKGDCPYTFGSFKIDDASDLIIEYYGDPDADDIKINNEGEIILYSESEAARSLGKVRIVLKGDYEAGQSYGFFDCVKYNGSWWLHKGETSTINAVPEENDIWTLFGAKGDKGEQGQQGIQGVQGPQGVQGVQGIPGEAATVQVGTVTTGEEGTQAVVTNAGTANTAVLNFTIPKGATGATGPQGIQGEKGETGATGPQGPQGEKGDPGNGFAILGYYKTLEALQSGVPSPDLGAAYAVGSAAPYNIYIWSGAEWINHGTIQGPQGPKGATGAQGPKGDKGDKGDTGATGPQGIQGPKGDKGDKGDTGATGATGAQGPQGEQGPQGIQGATGATGPQGATGAAAGFGTPTATASALAAGASPTVSVTASGGNTAKVFKFAFGIPKGATGATGPQGPQGIQGLQGIQGPKGDSATKATYVSGDVDFNDYTEAGFFYVGLGSNITNGPPGWTHGYLRVMTVSVTGPVVQTTFLPTNRINMRLKGSSTLAWGAWNSIALVSDIENTTITGASIDASGNLILTTN